MILKIKERFKIAVCALLYYSGILTLIFRNIIVKNRKFPGIILNYHHFCTDLSGEINPQAAVTTTVDEFKKQIIFIKKYFSVISYDELIDREKTNNGFEKPTLTITANDGLIDNMSLMFPSLEKENIPLHMFLVVGFIGTNWMLWTDKIGQMLLKTDAKEYRGNAVFEFERFPLLTMEEKRAAYNKIVETLKNVSIFARYRYIGEMKEALGV